jgi:hypothetical protein
MEDFHSTGGEREREDFYTTERKMGDFHTTERERDGGHSHNRGESRVEDFNITDMHKGTSTQGDKRERDRGPPHKRERVREL